MVQPYSYLHSKPIVFVRKRGKRLKDKELALAPSITFDITVLLTDDLSVLFSSIDYGATRTV